MCLKPSDWQARLIGMWVQTNCSGCKPLYVFFVQCHKEVGICSMRMRERESKLTIFVLFHCFMYFIILALTDGIDHAGRAHEEPRELVCQISIERITSLQRYLCFDKRALTTRTCFIVSSFLKQP